MAASVGVRYVSSEPWTDLLHVSPSQFNIQCTLGNDKFLQLSITNNGNDTIAWKLKTNRPGRYMVRSVIFTTNPLTLHAHVPFSKWQNAFTVPNKASLLVIITKIAQLSYPNSNPFRTPRNPISFLFKPPKWKTPREI